MTQPGHARRFGKLRPGARASPARAAGALAWREKLAWALREKVGTVLTASEVRDLVAEFDAMCDERASCPTKHGTKEEG